MALAAVGIGTLESVPSLPGHGQVSLLGNLAASDAAAVATAGTPFGEHPTGACARLESEYRAARHLLKNRQFGWYASTWPSYQALEALYVTSLGRGGEQCASDFAADLRAIDTRYWDGTRSPPAFDQGPHAFHLPWDLPRVDDNLWMGLAALRGYRMTGDRDLLQRAEAVFRVAIANWDPVKGGIYWEYHAAGATDYDKAVVSNAPAAVLGAALFAVTGRQNYLAWSGRILAWLESNLVDPRTGLYDDHVDDHTRPPSLDTAKLTYNQGVVIDAMAALATVDRGRYRLIDATELAERSMAYFKAHHSYGTPAFDAIWADSVLGTAGLYNDPSFSRQARDSVALAANAAPRHQAGLLGTGGEVALDGLARLPSAEYPRLSLVTARPG